MAFPGLLLSLLIVTLAREWKMEGIYNDMVLVFALGFAFMPEHSIISGETINRTLRDPKVERVISMVRWADRPTAPVLKVFWETMKAKSDR